MCKYCEQDEVGNLEWLCSEPDRFAYLEDYDGEWVLVIESTAMCCGRECRTEGYVAVTHCPMCGRDLSGEVDG